VELPLIYSSDALTADEREDRALEVLRRVGLEGREHHYPSQLSGGQQQRVAIARALMNRPAILLADEPTGNLDTRTSEEVMTLFQELNDGGMTVVLITHEADIARHAKRAVHMRDGKILTDEPVEQFRVAAAAPREVSR
jgi:putative ABC transport system ATP-binding protein